MLADDQSARTRASWPSRKRTDVPARVDRHVEGEARARDWRRERLQRDLDWHGPARDGRHARHDGIRPGRARRSWPRTSSAPGSPTSSRRPRRCVRASTHAAGTFDFVFLDAWKKDYKRFLDLMLPAPQQGRPLRRPQRRQQEERDGRLPRRDLEDTRALDDDRVAIERRDVSVGEEIGVRSLSLRRTATRLRSSLARASCAACRRGDPPAPVRRSVRASTCWSETS